MEITIANAIWAIVSAVIAGVITALVTRKVTMKELGSALYIFHKITPDRRDAISGRWTGTGDQVIGPDGKSPLELTIDWTLNIKESKISGDAMVIWDDEGTKKSIDLSLSGRYIDNDYFQIDYQDKDYKVLRYGTFFLHLEGKSDKLIGNFVGYAPEAQKGKGDLIYGSTILKKIIN